MRIQLIAFLLLFCTPFFLAAQYNPKGLEEAEEAIAAFKEKDSKFDAYFGDAYGYVVFPAIGKGASGIGGAFGTGTVFEQGTPIGRAKLTQLTIGLQFGGGAFRQVIFFEAEEDLQRFKESKFEIAAQASAVALEEGAVATLAYTDGVAVFTMTKAGLMYEASVGGQELKFKPYKSQ